MSGTPYHKENSWWTSLDFGSSLYHSRRYYCNLLMWLRSLTVSSHRKKKEPCSRLKLQCKMPSIWAVCVFSRFSHVQLFATLWIVACQAPLSMGFFRQEYWNGLSCPPPGDLPNPGIKPVSHEMQADSLLLRHQGNPLFMPYVPRNQWY